ncbi:MAG: hypothetical protein JRM80_06840 [Nitrososphaerota archaeon]|nr:hypothetical protein [Nitrososphaerota archaeon]
MSKKLGAVISVPNPYHSGQRVHQKGGGFGTVVRIGEFRSNVTGSGLTCDEWVLVEWDDCEVVQWVPKARLEPA